MIKKSDHSVDYNVKFCIVSAGCDCARFLDAWYQSIISQTYVNWRCIVALDPSSDGSEAKLKSLIGNDSRFEVLINQKKNFLLKNTCLCIDRVNDSETVIVTLDLDDSFFSNNALTRVAEEYLDPLCWLTYGSYIDSNGNGPFFCRVIPQEVWESNSLREYHWSSSQLRTFKKWLWDKIDKKDFKMPDGSWIKRATDRAFMYPMLEMAGAKHVRFIEEILYMYNVYGQQAKTHELEMEALKYILNKQPYSLIEDEKMILDHAIVMSETPAPCNFSCEYCYIPPGFERRKDTKNIFSKDYLQLVQKIGAKKILFWLCAIGEPFMMPNIDEIIVGLSKKHKVCVVSNLSFFGNLIPEKLIDLENKQRLNIGIYWSVHWNEMRRKNVLGRVLARVKFLLQNGIKVWPTLVVHPSYFPYLDEILYVIKFLGLRISLCRYRLGQSDLAGLEEESLIYEKYRDNPVVDFRIWDQTPECWQVSNGLCMAGKMQVVIDAWWRICTCHGDNGSAKFFGTFPEDIEKIELETVDVCKSTKCPCKHSVFYGVNSKFPHSFADILDGWDDFINT